jgi:hypothetical protein
VNAYLETLKSRAQLTSFQWESQDNAVSPFDFWYEESGRRSLLDVKCTGGDFDRNIHISLPELLMMRDSKEPYYIYRVYGINAGRATLRISDEMHTVARAVLDVLLVLPDGVSSDGVSVAPSFLKFGSEISLTMSETPELP